VVATQFSSLISGQAFEQASVSGKIVDVYEKGVPDVRIRAVRSGSKIAETRSASDGEYLLPVPKGTAFDLVFDQPGWQAGLYQALSGTAVHRVTKVLLRDGEILDPRSRFAAEYAQKYIGSLDR
jgi:hypothetical protein